MHHRWREIYVMFSLFWFGVKWLYTWKYSLNKAKLQLQNNVPDINIKNKNDLKYFCYHSYKFLFNYWEWVNNYINKGSPAYNKLYKGDNDNNRRAYYEFFWCYCSEPKQGVITVSTMITPWSENLIFG